MIPYTEKERYTIDDLAEIVMLLRSEDGCPWDKVQTHESIRQNLIEETYEVIEAIDNKDPALLREELGDLLLQVVFHARLEEEQEHFTLEDVCTDICQKLIVRHPHVFGNTQAENTADALKNWDAVKAETKHQTTRTKAMEDVAKTLPALMRAQKVCKRAKKEDARFASRETALAYMTKCMRDLTENIAVGDSAELEATMGELLLGCAGLAQLLDLSAEQALTDATNRTIDIFRFQEEQRSEQTKKEEA